MTMFTRSMSIPRPMRSVATKMRFFPCLNSLYFSMLQRTRDRAELHLRASTCTGRAPAEEEGEGPISKTSTERKVRTHLGEANALQQAC